MENNQFSSQNRTILFISSSVILSLGLALFIFSQNSGNALTSQPRAEIATSRATTTTTTTTIPESPTTLTEVTTTVKKTTTTTKPKTTTTTVAAEVVEPVIEEQQTIASVAENEQIETGPTAAQWQALRSCESGGNYQIHSGNGKYHGAYQFNIATWNSVAQSASRTDLVGVNPADASVADQDSMAKVLYSQRGAQPWPTCGRHLK